MIDFLKHLRLNYQFLILSGPFLLGGLFSSQVNPIEFLIQFLSIHIFLFGGATAYNSYWDKDEGPIGGLEHPPKMNLWMLYSSWLFQIIGLSIAFVSGFSFVSFYLLSMIFFWLYSSPYTRWKGRPFFSFIAIGFSTVVCSTLLGYFSFGGQQITLDLVIGIIGATFLILSMYPLSQIYQIEVDKKRGDMTFAATYGVRGVKNSFVSLFFLGLTLLCYALLNINIIFTSIFFIVTLIVGIYVYRTLLTISTHEKEYRKVMKIKYFGGLAFTIMMVLFIVFA